ncbi:hypothetical protein H1R20_g6535, partial [Candolleomyces eurysporus]
MIYIDQSYRAYYNYHNSQNQTNTETINSNNFSSTQARNSSLNGDARWTFRTDRNPGPFNSTASTQYFPSSPLTPNADQGHPIHTSTRPGPSRSPQYPQASSPMAEFPLPVVESTDPDWVGPGTSQRLAGAQVYQNKTDITAYSYDSAKREFVSYDNTPSIAKMKALYALSQDKVGSESLVSSSAEMLGTLDTTLNHISFPNTKWDNVRRHMGSGTSPTSSNPGSTPATSPGTGQCAGVADWSPATVYLGGDKASYNGRLWTAKWWTQNETPGGASGVWTDNGAC